jgi:hypothetical protein
MNVGERGSGEESTAVSDSNVNDDSASRVNASTDGRPTVSVVTNKLLKKGFCHECLCFFVVCVIHHTTHARTPGQLIQLKENSYFQQLID